MPSTSMSTRRKPGTRSRQARSTAVARRSASARKRTRSILGISASAVAAGSVPSSTQ
ncbi:hypothetical protein [Clavibacter michiganensis]|uniref:hypothetical protein n=1 Tax=Clavibacter michiganensis TaxID=28447 RepID=UPI00130E4A1D|nr:hypothetical protein [Clavibacter michiganensis]